MIDRILRWPELHKLVGLSRTTIWRLERINAFPSRILLSKRAVGWSQSSVLRWVSEQKFAKNQQDSICKECL